MKPLEGLRVLNLGWVWAGPVAGQTLAFLGADVLRVESRARLDMTRSLPPFAEGEASCDRSFFQHASWAGNGSITLNLETPEGVDLLLQLIARADVVLENYGPGVLERWGLSYEAMKGARPDIVLFSFPATGLYGPLREVRTYGLSLTSLTGLDSLTGYKDGAPVPMENAFSDPYVGILGGFAVLAALRYRDRTGVGQHIDCSQQEVVMQLTGPAYMDYVLNERVASPLGNEHPLAGGAPHGVFPCVGQDSWISIVILSDDEWQGLVDAMGKPDWAGADSFTSMAGRVANIDYLHRQLAGWTCEFEPGKLAGYLQGHGVAAAPVYHVADLLESAHYGARETFVEVEHPLGFRETLYGAYVKTSASDCSVSPGPVLGQDNDRVFLGELGLSEAQFRDLVARGVIA